MSDFAADYALHLKTVAETNAFNKTVIFDALSPAGITSITVTFDGCGDSGQIDDITAYSGEQQTEFPATKVTLRVTSWGQPKMIDRESLLSEAVEDLCYSCLEQTHGGWENNDGAYGEFAFDIAERKITLDFNGRFTDTWSDAHTF
ncbi:MAG: DUF6878 family protein [Candidatus Acidiferrales bacterium]